MKNKQITRSNASTRTRAYLSTAAMLVAWVGVQGCTTYEYNPNYCAALNIDGDAACRAKYGTEDDARQYCILGTDTCVDKFAEAYANAPDFNGCVATRPSSECHSPCGHEQSSQESWDCVPTDDDSTGTSTSGMLTTSHVSEGEDSTSGATAPASTTDEVTSMGDASSTGESTSTGADCLQEPLLWSGCVDSYGQIDTAGCALENATCILSPFGSATHSMCSTNCEDDCDCPLAPGGGTSVSTCAHLSDGDEGMDCYLDCSEDPKGCPDGMECTLGYICMAPTVFAPLYGDCSIVDCAPPAMCSTVAGGGSVCTQPCDNDQDCIAPLPPGGLVTRVCGNVISPPSMTSECYLACSTGGSLCPDGMDCITGSSDQFCMWPE